MEKRSINTPATIRLPSEFEVTDEMHRVIHLVRQKKNLLITGKAGSGKSTLLTYLRTSVFPEETIYYAYSGVASLNIGEVMVDQKVINHM
jgi:ABC-type lipoprotein export system ATPase subunit